MTMPPIRFEEHFKIGYPEPPKNYAHKSSLYSAMVLCWTCSKELNRAEITLEQVVAILTIINQ